ncbi:hypothetical protein EC912_10562 [Luteibacter rhizovicinus]|uniref:J domain-containing protein n=1 Tax=Luteibacter rhizovicinus TaxID=242606 RepID=A0A4R3YLY7_9GAMM|nr:J domain-containing protein [Luteibacter rhizovicinus]TCV93202.1 hypothetical protein EC912_10562 [Luteibacter rhizovicinus]
MTGSWWDVLGIAPTADMREIKRAYGTRLKQCRPEDDPQGFARLREAYEGLIAHFGTTHSRSTRAMPVRELAASTPEYASSENAEAIALPVRASPYDVAGLLMAEARKEHVSWPSFEMWLRARDDLLPLDFKAAVSRVLVRRLTEEDIPARQAIEIFAGFFDWDDYASQRRFAIEGIDLHGLETRLATRNLGEWLENERDDETVRRLVMLRRHTNGWRARWLVKSKRYRDDGMAALARAIGHYGYTAVGNVVGSDTLAFWERVSATRPNWLQVWMLAPVISTAIALAALFASARVFAPDPLGGAPIIFIMAIPAILLLAFAVNIGGRLWHQQGAAWFDRQRMAVAARLGVTPRHRPILIAITLFAISWAGWYWPGGFVSWPYYLLICILLAPAASDRIRLLGCMVLGILALGAMNSSTHSGKPAAAIVLGVLWTGRYLHGFTRRWRATSKLSETAVILILGTVVVFAMIAIVR